MKGTTILLLGTATLVAYASAHPYSKIPESLSVQDALNFKKSSSNSNSNSYSQSNQDDSDVNGVIGGKAFSGSKTSGYSTNGGSHSQSSSFSSSSFNGNIPFSVFGGSAGFGIDTPNPTVYAQPSLAFGNPGTAGLGLGDNGAGFSSGSFSSSYGAGGDETLENQVTEGAQGAGSYGSYNGAGVGSIGSGVNAGLQGGSSNAGLFGTAGGSSIGQSDLSLTSGSGYFGQSGTQPGSVQYWWSGPNSPFGLAGKPSGGCGTNACTLSGTVDLNEGSGGAHASNQGGQVGLNINGGNPFFGNGQAGSGTGYISAGSSFGQSASGLGGSTPIPIDGSKNPFLNGGYSGSVSGIGFGTGSSSFASANSGASGSSSQSGSFGSSASSGSFAASAGNPFLRPGSSSDQPAGPVSTVIPSYSVSPVFIVPQTSGSGNAGSGAGSQNPFFKPGSGSVVITPPISKYPGQSDQGFPSTVSPLPGYPSQTTISVSFEGSTPSYIGSSGSGFPSQAGQFPSFQGQTTIGSAFPTQPSFIPEQEPSGFEGGLTVSCSGQGRICVIKDLCVNGKVNNDRLGLTQVRNGPQQCKIDREICCTLIGSSGSSSNSNSGSASDSGSFSGSSGNNGQYAGSSGNSGQYAGSSGNSGQYAGSSGNSGQYAGSSGSSGNGGQYAGSSGSNGQFAGSSGSQGQFGQSGSAGSFGQSGAYDQSQQSGSYDQSQQKESSSFGSHSQSSSGSNSGFGSQTGTAFGSGSSLGTPAPGQIHVTPGIPFKKPTSDGGIKGNSAFGSSNSNANAGASSQAGSSSSGGFTNNQQTNKFDGGLFDSPSESGDDLSSGELTPITGNNGGSASNGYLPPIGSQSSDNVPAFSKPPKKDEPRNPPPLVKVPVRRPTFEPAPISVQVGCAAALICVEERFCTLEGVISPQPVTLTSQQIERRAPLSSCKNPDNGVIGKCCRDPNYVDPWPTGNLPANYSGGFDEQGFPTYLMISKTRPPTKKPPPTKGGFVQPSRVGFVQPTKGGFIQPTKNTLSPRPTEKGFIEDAQHFFSTFTPPTFPTFTPPTFPTFTLPPNSNPIGFIQGIFNPSGSPNTSDKPIESQGSDQAPTVSSDDSPGTAKPPSGATQGSIFGIPIPNFQNPFSKTGGNPEATDQLSTVIAPHRPGGRCGLKNQVVRPSGLDIDDVAFAEIPWQAMILSTTDRKLLCSGAIVAPNAVLTAAHCVNGLRPEEISIKAGEWKLGFELKYEEPLPFEIVKVFNVVPHPGYRANSPSHDIAILFLEHPLKLDQHVDVLCLGDIPQPTLGRKCISTGWGKIILQVHAAGALMHSIDVDIVPQDECKQRLQGAESQIPVDNTVTCVKAQKQRNNLCQVDVGGPLACDRGDGSYELTGIYSRDTGCLPTNQVATFALIDTNWLKTTLAYPPPKSPSFGFETSPGETSSSTNFQPNFGSQIHQPGPVCDCQKSNLPPEINQYLPPAQ